MNTYCNYSLCPFCAGSLEKDAKACKFCGRHLVLEQPEKTRKSLSTFHVFGAFLIGMMLAAGYLGFNPWKTLQVLIRSSGVLATAAEASESTTFRAAFDQPTQHPESKENEVRSRFIATASATMEEIKNVNSSIKTGVDYDQYLRQTVDLAAKVDVLLRVADETKLYDSTADVQQFCKIASAIFHDHNQAVENWKLENLLRAEKDSVRSSYEAKVRGVTDVTAVNQSVRETAEKLDQLTAQVMTAITARYDLWIDAQKQADSAAALLSKVML